MRWMLSNSTTLGNIPSLKYSEKKNQQQSVRSERLYDMMSMFPILGFAIINMVSTPGQA